MSSSTRDATPAPEFLSPKEFAAASSFSIATIRRYLEAGVIPKFQPAGPRGRIGIPRSALAIVAGSQHDVIPLTPSDPAPEQPLGKRLSGPAPAWLSRKL